MRAYASRTGTRRNLAALRAAGWGLFVSATGVHRNEDFPFIIDNGAWTFFKSGSPFDPAPFRKVLDSLGDNDLCEGIVAPDIVCGGPESLTLTLAWAERLADYIAGRCVIYLPVQPGIDPELVERWLCPQFGVFVGGDDAWKEKTCGLWASLAHSRRARCHVGRVNSRRRLMICKEAGVDSFDGSGPSRFEVVLHEMERFRSELCQLGLVMPSSAWVFFEPEKWIRIEVKQGEALEAILLRAEHAGAPAAKVYEVQLDDGSYIRCGAGFEFVPLVD